MLDFVRPMDAFADSDRLGLPRRDDSVPLLRLQDATDTLRTRYPSLSAAYGLRPHQWVFLAVVATLIWAFAAASGGIGPTLLPLLTVPFICIICLRCLALWTIVRPRRTIATAPRLPDRALPRYTVLVPVFREAEVAGQLISGLAALDYPRDKLEILFITEERDALTQAALGLCDLADNMRVVIVPDGRPRTKPRALNYALAEAIGDFVVVFDAEDEPDCDQLRCAVAAFRRGGRRLGCLQGQLKIHNADQSFLTRQFAIECGSVQLHPPGARTRRSTDSSGRNLQSFPPVCSAARRRLGSLQRDRGCRSWHSPGAVRLEGRHAAIGHLGRGAHDTALLVSPADALAERLAADGHRAHAASASTVAGRRCDGLLRSACHVRQHVAVGVRASNLRGFAGVRVPLCGRRRLRFAVVGGSRHFPGRVCRQRCHSAGCGVPQWAQEAGAARGVHPPVLDARLRGGLLGGSGTDVAAIPLEQDAPRRAPPRGGYGRQVRKLPISFRPRRWLFSGWNCVPTTLSRATTAVTGPP